MIFAAPSVKPKKSGWSTAARVYPQLHAIVWYPFHCTTSVLSPSFTECVVLREPGCRDKVKGAEGGGEEVVVVPAVAAAVVEAEGEDEDRWARTVERREAIHVGALFFLRKAKLKKNI